MIEKINIGGVDYPVVNRSSVSEDDFQENVIYFWKKGSDDDPFYKCSGEFLNGSYFEGIGENVSNIGSEFKSLENALNDLKFWIEDSIEEEME